MPVSTSSSPSTATLVSLTGRDGLGSTIVAVPSGVETSTEPSGPIVSAPRPRPGRAGPGSRSARRASRRTGGRRACSRTPIAIASTVSASIVIVVAAESNGPSNVTVASEPGGSMPGSSTPSRRPSTVAGRRPEEVDVAERQVEGSRFEAVPVDIGPVDRDAVGLPDGDAERRIGLDLDVEVRGPQAGRREARPDERGRDRRAGEPRAGDDEDGRDDQDEQAAAHRSARPRSPAPRARRPFAARRRRPVRRGPMIEVSWPLPASRTTSPGRARSNAAAIAAGRSAISSRSRSTPPAGFLRPLGDRLEDRLAVLAAGILVGDDDEPAALAGDPAHHRPLGRVPLPADPNTAISPPPRAAATGASTSRTASSEAGLWAKSTITPNGWPASIDSIRPGTPLDRLEAGPDRRRVEAEALAQRDDRQRVVGVEAAGQPEIERRPRRSARRRPRAAAARPPRPGSAGRRRRRRCRR